MTTIIGISGNSGAGKTTVTKQLSEKLRATAVFWDEYDDISSGPDDYVAWYENAQDYRAWKYDDLANTLKTLKEGRAILCPATHQELKPTPFIFFDAPLGRMHIETGQYIDINIHIDVPLDISLGRRLLRDFQENETTKAELLETIDFYLNHSRKLFVCPKIKNTADHIIDGTLSGEQQVQLVEGILSQSECLIQN